MRFTEIRRPTVDRLGLVVLVSAVQLSECCKANEPTVPKPRFVGRYAVSYRTADVTDEGRNKRRLPLHAWYPTSQQAHGNPAANAWYSLVGVGRFSLSFTSSFALDNPQPLRRIAWPLLVFSHGSPGIPLQSVELLECLASHGFVVVAVHHTGDTYFDRFGGTQKSFKPSDRKDDVFFIIKVFTSKDLSDVAALRDLTINVLRIGVLGVSRGGETALSCASAQASRQRAVRGPR